METPGIKMDCLVAEKIFGAEWKDVGEDRKSLHLEGLAIAMQYEGEIFSETMPGQCIGDGFLPHWSTDLSTAWGIVEHFTIETTDLSIEKSGGNWTFSNVTCEGLAQSIQMAICRWGLAMAHLKK